MKMMKKWKISSNNLCRQCNFSFKNPTLNLEKITKDTEFLSYIVEVVASTHKK